MQQEARAVLLKYWGYSQFRPLQEDIIQSVLNKENTIALMPTGGGKSICYQVPALMQEGICIVISPLIALMKDQVENLVKRDIKAIAITSGMGKQEVDIALDNCVHGKIKFLYLSPERLMSDLVQTRIGLMNVNLIAVDEAHCISQWGFDFRPAYLKIADIRKIKPTVPLLALTATATKIVQEDIVTQLQFDKYNLFKKSFERKNLSYLVYADDDKLKRAVTILQKTKGSSIVYVRSRKKTKEASDYFQSNGIASNFYHAGLMQDERSKRQEDWMYNKARVMVATNAFGMGIDKSDVRVVIHLDTPESIEAYYQEAGRAGRDEKPAYAILFHNSFDKTDLRSHEKNQFPDLDTLKNVYHALGNFLNVAIGSGQGAANEFDLIKFAQAYNLGVVKTFNSLRILQEEGYLAMSDALFIPSRLHFTVSSFDLYKFQVEQPKLDHFLKTVLRSYGGLFDEYVRIHEKEIAIRLKVSVEEVVRTLYYLQKLKIATYVPSTDKPQITYLQPRCRKEDLTLDHSRIQFRKERYLDRIESIIYYGESANVCRGNVIQHYFGETPQGRCGNCDYCRSRNKLSLNDLQFEELKTKIKAALASPTATEELIKTIAFKNNDTAIKTIQWLMDADLISLDKKNRLQWN